MPVIILLLSQLTLSLANSPQLSLSPDKKTVKVSDFGLSKSANADHEYSVNVVLVARRGENQAIEPWLPRECSERGEYSEKSDVWAFGVVVWEVFSRSNVDGVSMDREEVLPLPRYCPREIR